MYKENQEKAKAALIQTKEQNIRHKAKMENEAALSLMSAFNYRTCIDLGLEDALAIIEEIEEGKVKNLSIKY